MNDYLKELSVREYATNKDKTKVEQKESRIIKSEITQAFAEKVVEGTDIDVMFDSKGKPVLSLPNGLIIGFDFSIKNLDSELLTE